MDSGSVGAPGRRSAGRAACPACHWKLRAPLFPHPASFFVLLRRHTAGVALDVRPLCCPFPAPRYHPRCLSKPEDWR
eukprot:8880449-Pyramimonas_sp.AAC.1